MLDSVGPSSNGRIYYPALDGLRFLAFALVYLFHQDVLPLTESLNAIGVGLARLGGPLASIPTAVGDRIRSNGWIGVQIFFALSGFLIASLLLREEERYGRIDLRAFWARRILRIWPLYYLVLFLATFLLPWATGWNRGHLPPFLVQQFPAFLAFLGNWSMGLHGYPINDAVAVLWTVCVEEQFYIVLPLVFLACPRWFRTPLVAATIGLAIGLRQLAATARASGELSELMFRFNSLTQLDTLMAGVGLALLARPGSIEKPTRQTRLLGFYQGMFMAALIALLLRENLGRGTVLAATWDLVAIWSVSIGLVASLVPGQGWLGHILSARPLVGLGRISYGLYMYHLIAITLTTWGLARLGWFPFHEWIGSLCAAALTLGLAVVSYIGFERPFLRLKGRWTRVPSRPN